MVIALFTWGLYKPKIVPSIGQLFVEKIYGFIYALCVSHIGVDGVIFVPLVLTFFLLFLCGNIVGLLPFGGSFTTHFIVNLTMCFIVLIVGYTYAIVKKNFALLSIFKSRTPTTLILKLFFSPFYMSTFILKLVTIAVRLSVNIFSGHLALIILAAVVSTFGFYSFISAGALLAMIGFEVFIAIIQAYIFTVLLCILLARLVHVRSI